MNSYPTCIGGSSMTSRTSSCSCSFSFSSHRRWRRISPSGCVSVVQVSPEEWTYPHLDLDPPGFALYLRGKSSQKLRICRGQHFLSQVCCERVEKEQVLVLLRWRLLLGMGLGLGCWWFRRLRLDSC